MWDGYFNQNWMNRSKYDADNTKDEGINNCKLKDLDDFSAHNDNNDEVEDYNNHNDCYC
jgi:hypothetical protein